jgi:hypothetical protein
MTTETNKLSSWIESIAYVRRHVPGLASPVGFLAIFTGADRALLYGPSDTHPEGVPSYIPGLLVAGRVGKGRSVGRAYNKLVKGHYGYRAVDRHEMNELRALLAAKG